MNEEKLELINQLLFLVQMQENVWRYHPNNPNAVNAVEEYDELQEEINSVENKLENLN
jgi:hypothetical protein